MGMHARTWFTPNLSKSLHPDPRCAEKAADGAPARGAADAPGQERHDEARTGTDRRCGAIEVREANPPTHLTPQHDHLMPQYDILRLKLAFRFEW
jgi:hypothetical protein